MVSNDLAMTAKMGNLELMIFTSLDIAALEKQSTHNFRFTNCLTARLVGNNEYR